MAKHSEIVSESQAPESSNQVSWRRFQIQIGNLEAKDWFFGWRLEERQHTLGFRLNSSPIDNTILETGD